MIHNFCNGALEAQCANNTLGVTFEGFQYNPHGSFLTCFSIMFLHIHEYCFHGLTQLWAFLEAQLPKFYLFTKTDATHQSVTAGP